MSKKGFTLVEVLIVLAIVGLLSSLAVNGYLNYRRDALLDLSADAFVAQVGELKEKTVQAQSADGTARAEKIRNELSGLSDGASEASTNLTSLCHGLRFTKNDDFYDVRKFSQEFDSAQGWYGMSDEGWRYQGCGVTDSFLTEGVVELDEKVRIVEILGGDVGHSDVYATMGDFVLRFNPPDGVMELRPSAESRFSELYIVLQYENDVNVRKTVALNLVNGNARVIKDLSLIDTNA